MKHTVLTQNNINATIDIPLEKLQTKNPHFMCNNNISPQIILTPLCCQNTCYNSCCTCQQSSMKQLKTMIKQLQQAYKQDVSQLNFKINLLEKQRNSLKQQCQENKNAQNRYIINLQSTNKELIKQKQENSNLKKVCQRLRKQRQTIMRTKITQFDKAKYDQYQKSLQRTKDAFDLELTNTLTAKTIAFELQNSKKQQLIAHLRSQIKLISISEDNLRSQIKALKSVFQIQNKNSSERQSSLKKIVESKQYQIQQYTKSLKLKQQQKQKLLLKIKELQYQNANIEKQLQNFRSVQIPNIYKIIQQKEEKILTLLNEKSFLQESNSLLKQTAVKLQKQISQLNQTILTNNLFIQSLQKDINILKQDRSKICDQRVSVLIERQTLLDNLEIQVLTLRKQNHQLMAQLVIKNSFILDRDHVVEELSRQLQNCKKTQLDMRTQISQLNFSKNNETLQFQKLLLKLKKNYEVEISETIKAQKVLFEVQLLKRQQLADNIKKQLQCERMKVQNLKIQIKSHRSLLQTQIFNHLQRQDQIKRVLLSKQAQFTSDLKMTDLKKLIQEKQKQLAEKSTK